MALGKYMHILIALPNEESFSVTLICYVEHNGEFRSVSALLQNSVNFSLLHIQHLPLSYVL